MYIYIYVYIYIYKVVAEKIEEKSCRRGWFILLGLINTCKVIHKSEFSLIASALLLGKLKIYFAAK